MQASHDVQPRSLDVYAVLRGEQLQVEAPTLATMH